MRNISILGATGSIGTQTLDVIRHSEGINLIGVTANTSVNKIKEIIDEFSPKYVAMMDEISKNEIKEYVKYKGLNIEVLYGIEGLKKIASLDEIDTVVTSVVGMIGLEPTIEAIRHKKDIALANKETLVVAGELVMNEAKKYGVEILPVDSEQIILTASGGPFRGKKIEDLENIKVEEALNHPNWSMGRKITIDSSTLMNKGLEVIEAHWLFNCPYENIQVLVHPQSVIHSMVEYSDNSIIAQIGSADMRLPIQYALNYPDRKNSVAKGIDFYEISKLTFEKPDMDTFKCLKLAFKAGMDGGLMPTILNGANEEVVDLFLNEKIPYIKIADIIEECMEHFKEEGKKEVTLENVILLDKKVKEYVRKKYN